MVRSVANFERLPMQYRINTTTVTADDLLSIDWAISDVDPAAVSDLDPAVGVLRVSTVMGGVELVNLLNQAGHAVSMEQLELVPSECCGGCGG